MIDLASDTKKSTLILEGVWLFIQSPGYWWRSCQKEAAINCRCIKRDVVFFLNILLPLKMPFYFFLNFRVRASLTQTN